MLRMHRFCYFSFCMLMHVFAYAQTQKISPEELRLQLAAAEQEFEQAKKQFSPWYSGPLLTGSPSVIPVGEVNIQPYIFVTNQYANYDSAKKLQNQNNLVICNPVFLLQTGLFSKADIVFNVGGVLQWQNKEFGLGCSDFTIQLGLGLLEETLYSPALKFYINQSFPTGKFENAYSTKQQLNLTGNGSFVTSISLNFAKVVWWLTPNPINCRVTSSVDVYATDVSVQGMHAYGGASNTKGTITRGQNWQLNIASEVSIVQNCAFACDLVYTYANTTLFEGFAGTDDTGAFANNGSPVAENLSIAPALEYNFDDASGMLFGVWFSVYGRNTSAFFSGVLTYQTTF